VRGWLHSTDPHFREKVTDICDLYLHPPPGSTVPCIDEMTGVQALEHRYPDHWGPGRPRDCPRREWEYIRHGTQAVIAAFDVRTGQVVAICGARRTAKHLRRFMRTVAAQYPDGPVHIIWDNLISIATAPRSAGRDSIVATAAGSFFTTPPSMRRG
jgi:hypothetical protein